MGCFVFVGFSLVTLRLIVLIWVCDLWLIWDFCWVAIVSLWVWACCIGFGLVVMFGLLHVFWF